MTVDARGVMRYCFHCGAPDVRRLGTCKVCREVVCERCGNTQYIQGECHVTHDACQPKGDDSGFSMIKFVK